jgi:hypothetical protein
VKVGVWCALNARRIVGPVFFNETINSERYVQVILRQFFPDLTEEKRFYGWFQQDSDSAHTVRIRVSMQALSDVFGDRIISRGIWPVLSPDLNPCNFFLMGLFEGQGTNSNPRREELTENIRTEITNIPAEPLQMVNQNFCRCEECLRVEG